MELITKDKALELLDECVAERGADYVYDEWGATGSCRYVNDKNEPSCIVGLALFKAGVSIEQLEGFKSGDNFSGIAGRNDLRSLMTMDAFGVFNEAQSVQDNGFSWGEALNGVREV